MEANGTFLTRDEIATLTGYKRKAEQCRQLSHMGIKFVPNRLGLPLVLRKALEASLGAPAPADEAMAALDKYERRNGNGT